MTSKPLDTLETLLLNHQSKGMEKIQSKINAQAQIDRKTFFYLFGICTRWFDNDPVDIQNSEFWRKADAFGVLESWQWPSAARLYLLLLIAKHHAKSDYIDLYTALFDSADVQECILLIQSLAFIPHPEAFEAKARTAARSNITTLFRAVAHNNNYAYQHFDQSGWNQLVLKAAFLNEPIVTIHGLKSRNNTALTAMLRNYANERQAASRTVPWDLWCCVAWKAETEEVYECLKIEFLRGDTKTKAAIALALSENHTAPAKTLAQQLLEDNGLKALSPPLSWGKIQKLTA